MRSRQPGRWIAAAGGLLAAVAPAPAALMVGLTAVLIAPAARAADGAGVAAGAAALLLPSEFGAAASDPASPRLVIGWSWQLPLYLSPFSELEHHRAVSTVDLLPRSDGASWRGRLGYRYDRNHVFGGAGIGVDSAGVNLSPEIGVKFAQLLDEPRAGLEISLHLLARAEIAAESGRVRGATFLLGWNLFQRRHDATCGHLFGGAGIGFDGKDVTASPEIGVKLAHAERDYGDGLDTSLHVAARADVGPTTGRLSTTILLGWNLF